MNPSFCRYWDDAPKEKPACTDWIKAKDGGWERGRTDVKNLNAARVFRDGSWMVWNAAGASIAHGGHGGKEAADAWIKSNPDKLSWRLPYQPFPKPNVDRVLERLQETGKNNLRRALREALELAEAGKEPSAHTAKQWRDLLASVS